MPIDRNEYARQWRAKNKGKVAEANKRWRDKDPQNRERTREIAKEWNRNNAELIKERTGNNREKYNEYMRQWRLKNIEKVRAREVINERKRNYGITAEQYNELLEQCDGKCPICGREFGTGRKGPHIDHCHTTKVVRGLICGRCNCAEGHLKTSENALRLYEYMKRNELFHQGSS